MFDIKDLFLTQLCSTHENQELLASTVATFGAWLHSHVAHYLVEEVINDHSSLIIRGYLFSTMPMQRDIIHYLEKEVMVLTIGIILCEIPARLGQQCWPG